MRQPGVAKFQVCFQNIAAAPSLSTLITGSQFHILNAAGGPKRAASQILKPLAHAGPRFTTTAEATRRW